MRNILARRTKRMGSSAIREILKVIAQPGMISFAGGIPAVETFPIELIKKLSIDVLDKYGGSALQYDLTEGFAPLREALAEYLAKKGIRVGSESVYVTSGSQQLLDCVGKVLLDEGDKIAVESPTYLGALQAFSAYEPEYVSMKTDDNGLIPESLEETLTNHEIKFVYLVPTFQNPTGRTINLERRKEIAEILIKYEALLVEDDPYGELRYRGKALPAIQTMAPDNVIYTSTLSKVFAPGLRIGYYVGPRKVCDWLVKVKQGSDLHTSTFNQALAAEYIKGGHIDKQIKKNIEIYRPKQKAMLEAMKKYFSSKYRWIEPDGGMFVWVEGSKEMDMEKIYWKAIEKKVAFVPGKFFFAKVDDGLNTMRLNFSMVDVETIWKGMEILGKVLKEN